MAVKSMGIVYRDALAVLVVDSTLTEISENMNNEELLLRVKAAPWAQRLWTYQEACLARDLYFQVGGGDKVAAWSQDLVIPIPSRRSNHSLSYKHNLLEYTTAYLVVEAASLQLFGSSGPQDFHDL